MAKSLKQGEALPPMPGNTFTALISLCVFFSMATGAGYGAIKMGMEEKMQSLLPAAAEPLALPLAASLFHVFVMQWLAFCVNNARIRYNVPWPNLYAESTHPDAIPYNCVQRAHQHFLEQTLMVGILMAVASTEYPFSAGACTMVFTFSKIIGNVLGYGSGKASRRNWGMFGYLGLIVLMGLAVFATAKKFGLDAEGFVAAGVEGASPYVTAAAEKAKPYVDAAAEKAKPYVDDALEKAKPYVEQATEAAKPYVAQATEAAGPYVAAAKTSMGL